MNAICQANLKPFAVSGLCTLLLIFGFFPNRLFAGMDEVILRNGDRITGEIEKLNNGNLEIDADYGDSNFIVENYEDVPDDPTRSKADQNSAEAVGAVELNIFDIGDLELFTVFSVFPSLSEFGRVRMDFNSDLRYEFISDFNISLGFTNNYDSSPPVDTPKNDYVFATAIGWSY
jgi:hypothetical protein